MAFAAPGAAELLRPAAEYFLEHQAGSVCRRNLVQVWQLGRSQLLNDQPLQQAMRRYLSYDLICPDAGTYRFCAEDDEACCSVHGALREVDRLDHLPASSPLAELLDRIDRVSARLRFTKHGVSTVVDIERD